MLFIHNIQSVAKYESIILVRSWFFKIFTVLAILFLGFFDAAMLLIQDNNTSWILKAIPANIPYVNLLLLNTGQAIIAIFLSSEFLKRDKKLDTSEVFYVRPLSNAEYVIGKIWGNLRVFLILNLVVMGIALLFNYLAPGVSIDWMSYLTYFLIISIPTLIFIIGLSIFLMLMFKNQALTFIILLGYIGLTIFYISDKFYYLFDYMVYSLPLVKSEIVGFTNLLTVLNHRSIYLFAGLAFLCFTIALFGRLPNSSRSSYPWLALGCGMLLISIYDGYNHVSTILKGEKDRAFYTQINNKYVHTPKMIIDHYDIFVEQQAEHIVSEVTMQGRALEQSSVFTFCLNPGLVIESVEKEGKNIDFTRDNQIILIDFGKNISQNETVSFTIKYKGSVTDNFCYLDIPKEILQEERKLMLLNTDKKYSFQTGEYLLLTPETYWYPSPGTSYSDESPDWQQTYFSRFSLHVKPLQGLIPLSQGKGIMDENGVYSFAADHPSQSLQLLIGKYNQLSIDADSVEYSVWYIDGHDYFTAVFDSIRDTIPHYVTSLKENMERTYKLSYPFDRFSVVEVPAQFFSYSRAWSQAQETVQPEMVLFPEKGWIYDQLDFERSVKNQVKWAKRRGQEINDNEAKMRALNGFLSIFSRMEGNANFSAGERGAMEITTQANPYFLFPQLYNFRYNIFSPEWPVANRLIELYMQNRSGNAGWERNINGLSNDEKASLLMKDYAFKDLLASVEHRNLLDNIIRLKAYQLFALPEYNMDIVPFRDSLYSVLERNTFRNIQFENLLDTLEQISESDIRAEIHQWNHPTPLPFYVIDQPEVTRYNNRGQESFVLKLSVRNDSDADGYINVTTQAGGGGFGGGRGFGGGFGGGMGQDVDPRTNRKVPLAAHQTKQLISIWDETPRQVTINTLISENLPSNVNLPIRNVNQEVGRPLEEEGDYVTSQSNFLTPDEVVVDNEDSLLFSLSAPALVGLLPQWLDRIEDSSFKYSGIQGWRPPLQWTATTNAGYYGSYIRSAYVVKSGDGSQTATWKVPVPAPGPYEVYYWIFSEGGGGRGPGGPGGGRNHREEGEYHFKVKYDEEVEDAFIDLRRANNNGWELIGVYYFSSDTISVTLSNDCKRRTVAADAVRIVKRQ